MEAKLHRDIFSLFYIVWTNPDSKIFQILKYLLENSEESSRTWAIHITHLSKRYNLSDPLDCLNSTPPRKEHFKETVTNKIISYHEKHLRSLAANNSRMTFLNVSVIGLKSGHHPALKNLITTREVQKARTHLKMLAGDYYTYEVKASQQGGSGHCRCCLLRTRDEDVTHILTECLLYVEIRDRIFKEYSEACSKAIIPISFEDVFMQNQFVLCQFILDPSSLNLDVRISTSDRILEQMFEISRDYCYAVNVLRLKTLKFRDES